HRAEVVHARRKRWTRRSPACRVIDTGELVGIERVDVASGVALEIDALVARHGLERRELVFELRGGARVFVLAGREWRELRRAWWAAVRLDEHGIAVARPLCLARAPRTWAAFELSTGAQPCAGERLDPRRLRELGRLCAQLADRGLWPLADTAHPIWF